MPRIVINISAVDDEVSLWTKIEGCSSTEIEGRVLRALSNIANDGVKAVQADLYRKAQENNEDPVTTIVEIDRPAKSFNKDVEESPPRSTQGRPRPNLDND